MELIGDYDPKNVFLTVVMKPISTMNNTVNMSELTH